MLTNLLYSEKQLIKKDIEKYLKKISILIRKDEIKRIKEKTTTDYGKLDEKTLKTS